MQNNLKIAVVVPCYNEETQIIKTLSTMPDYLDKVVVVDDCSKDRTVQLVQNAKENSSKIELIQHDINQGVGGAIASGYNWCKENDVDIAVVMAGDGQMDPDDLPNLLAPIIRNEADYTKGNRLFANDAYEKIPKVRFYGNAILSLLTKIASGYWHLFDSQTGYTAINKKALHTINWNKMYKRYGQPNDLLVRLNVFSFRVLDVPIKPVYNIGEKSGIKVRRVVFTISWLLIKLFFWRLKEKYIIRDFHPLVFFYMLGFGLVFTSFFLGGLVVYKWFTFGFAPPLTSLALMFSFSLGLQSIFFAMWFDSVYDKK